MVTAVEPNRGNRKIGQLLALHSGVNADHQKICITTGRGDVVFLKPLGLDDIAGERDRLLLVLRGKEQLAHALFHGHQGFQGVTVWVDNIAGLSFVHPVTVNRNLFVHFRDGRDLQLMPATLFQEATGQIIFVDPLHNPNFSLSST
jgi:hypothetical protein